MKRGFAGICVQAALVGSLVALLLMAGQPAQLAAQPEVEGSDRAVDWVERARFSVSAAEEPGIPFFGSAVALSADGNTAVVGARGAANEDGLIYVFEKPAGGWATTTGYTARLSVLDTTFHSLSGDVVVSADGSTIVGGAHNEEALYVWVRPPGGWDDMTETARLTASDIEPLSGALLACAVAISHDGGTIVAGALMFDDSAGAAYVWVRPPGGWTSSTETARLSPNVISGHFGESVAISGDGNTIAVGSAFEYCAIGAVYLFARPAGGWVTTVASTRLLASDPQEGIEFGSSVAVAADGSTIAVGAKGEGFAPMSGKAYVFVRPGATWANGTETATLTPGDGVAGNQFGTSIALSDGGDAVLVGAQYFDRGPGAAYFFARPAGGWATATETQKLVDSDADGEDSFGYALAMDGPGHAALVGAYMADNWRGAAYVFEPALPTADLCIEKSAWPTSRLAIHDPITYTVVLDNAGAAVAEGIVLTDTLPVALDFDRWVPGGQPAGAAVSLDRLTWGGDLAAGETITFAFVVTHVAETAGVVTNVATFRHAGRSGSDAAAVAVGLDHAVYLPLVTRTYLPAAGR